MNGMIDIIIFEPGRPASPAQIKPKADVLERIVGGKLAFVHPIDRTSAIVVKAENGGEVLRCNRLFVDAKGRDHGYFRGIMVAVGLESVRILNHRLISLTHDQKQTYMELYRNPQGKDFLNYGLEPG